MTQITKFEQPKLLLCNKFLIGVICFVKKKIHVKNLSTDMAAHFEEYENNNLASLYAW